MIYLRLLLLSFMTHAALAQVADSSLSQDPVFNTILTRRLKYPRQAQWFSSYGRLFAQFTIDSRGRVQDISILNHSVEATQVGFEPTIIAALKRMPSLSLRHTGQYILPVSFVLSDYRHKNKLFVPTDSLYIQDLAGRVILKEVKIIGSTVNSKARIEATSRDKTF